MVIFSDAEGKQFCSHAMASWLYSLRNSHAGYVVFVATWDEASNGLEDTALPALQAVLGSSLTELRFRRMYALISTVGGTPYDEAIATSEGQTVSAAYSYVSCLPPSPPNPPLAPGVEWAMSTDQLRAAVSSGGNSHLLLPAGERYTLRGLVLTVPAGVSVTSLGLRILPWQAGMARRRRNVGRSIGSVRARMGSTELSCAERQLLDRTVYQGTFIWIEFFPQRNSCAAGKFF